jgi:hypothetical protein
MSLDGTRDFPGALTTGALFEGPMDLGTVYACPPGGQVYFVRGDGSSVTTYSYDPPQLQNRLSASVQKALSYCVAGRGDVVAVLPGHTESIAAADGWSNLVSGVRIVGLGQGTRRPTITWTAAASTVLLDQAGCSIENMILNMDPGTGTVTVAAPITISAAGCAIKGCQIRMGTDANAKVTIGITTTAAADDLSIIGNEIYGATAAECTTMIQLVGADRLKFCGNTIAGATSSVNVGVIRFLTTASTFIKMLGNVVRNNKAASVEAITGMAGISGEVDDLFMTTLANDNLANCFSTPASLTFGMRVGVANLAGERAAAFGTAST